MPTPTSDRQRQFFVLFLLAMLPAGNALNPCLDVDTWWHLRVGKFIVEEKRLPEHDPFSQLGQQEKVPWIAYSWLYELLLDATDRIGGLAGILMLRHLLDLLTFCGMAWFFLRWALNPWVGIATLALATVAVVQLMAERPWHFTILFTTLTLHAVLSIREGSPARRFAWLPAIYVLWANIHIQFVMGFMLLGLGWLVTLAEWLQSRAPLRREQGKGLFLLGLACSLATLLTPYHVRLFVVIWEYASQTAVLKMVQELQPPDLLKFQWWNLPLMALLVAAAVCTSLQRFRLWDLALLGSALFFSLRMQRDIWYGVLASGAIVVRTIGRRASDERPFPAWQIVLVSLLSLLLMRGVWEMSLSQGKTIASCNAESYPVEAVEFVRENHIPGPLYNNFDWGGYLIWALPELPVIVDGRTNLYGEERLWRSLRVWYGKEQDGLTTVVDWEEDPDLIRANMIIAPSNAREIEKKEKAGEKFDIYDLKSPLTERLRESQRWKIAHEDRTAVVFVRVKTRAARAE